VIFKYRLKRRTLEKLRIVYTTGYIHEMWVYNLKISRDGAYSWRHYDDANRFIDLQIDKIIGIFVVNRKKVFYWAKKRKPPVRKPKIQIEQFKPPPPRPATPFGYGDNNESVS
jgi:hypothetical protein